LSTFLYLKTSGPQVDGPIRGLTFECHKCVRVSTTDFGTAKTNVPTIKFMQTEKILTFLVTPENGVSATDD
jgi:hypothetical protein